MPTLETMVEDFLAQKRIAVAGVSRSDKDSPANLIYRKLRAAGYRVFALNPHAASIEGDACFPNLKAVPEGVDAVVVVTPPQAAEEIVRECADLGVLRVWLHRAMGTGSVSQKAVTFCREHKIAVISGGCPMMFCPPVDFGHKCLRWFLRITGGLPKS